MFFFVNLFSQINPEDYAGVPSEKKVKIFVDNFDNNKYFWIKKSSPSTSRIADGFFYLSNDYEFSSAEGKAISYDGNKNWEIETSIKFISGEVEDFSGLMWGNLVFGKKYIFAFSSLGKYEVKIIDGFDEKILAGPEKLDTINKTWDNDLLVRKYSNKYYLFINKKLVYTFPYTGLPGQYIGFSIAPKTMIRINFLKLSYIKE